MEQGEAESNHWCILLYTGAVEGEIRFETYLRRFTNLIELVSTLIKQR